jgi:hypothetical protein
MNRHWFERADIRVAGVAGRIDAKRRFAFRDVTSNTTSKARGISSFSSGV